MTMRSKDIVKQMAEEFRIQFTAALKSGKEDDLADAMTQFGEKLSDSILADAEQFAGELDNGVLNGRGTRALTQEETAFYREYITAAQAPDFKQALSNVTTTVPPTIIDRVFEDITEDHPLLRYIDLQNTGLLTRIIMSQGDGVATWGALTAAIAEELDAGFIVIDLDKKKESAFIPIPKAMLDLGPAWLDRYVRTFLSEALAAGLELAAVDGTGKDEPRGMSRKLSGDTDGIFPRKTALPFTEISPEALAPILSAISVNPNTNKRRMIPRLLFVCNIADFYNKIYPATTVRAADGKFATDVWPDAVDVVPTAALEEGMAVAGIASRYFLGLGTSQGGKLEYSDEYKFLEDERVYLIKLYGDGTARDENAFQTLDISELKPASLKVEVVGTVTTVSDGEGESVG
jgi:hypothetical protein